MSYLDYTKRNRNTMAEYTLCLTIEEAVLIKPALLKLKDNIEKKYLKYKDIQDSGEATTLQQNLYIINEENLEMIINILTDIEDFENVFKRR